MTGDVWNAINFFISTVTYFQFSGRPKSELYDAVYISPDSDFVIISGPFCAAQVGFPVSASDCTL